MKKIQPKSNPVGAGTGRGGARKGAGRKKGSAGAATIRTREIANQAALEGVTPLEFMLQIMRSPSDHKDARVQMSREAMRFEAAKAAAPFIHPRLQAIEHSGTLKLDLGAELAALNLVSAAT